MMEQNKKNQYEAPEMTELVVRVERGYAVSKGLGQGEGKGSRSVESRVNGGTWGGEVKWN